MITPVCNLLVLSQIARSGNTHEKHFRLYFVTKSDLFCCQCVDIRLLRCGPGAECGVYLSMAGMGDCSDFFESVPLPKVRMLSLTTHVTTDTRWYSAFLLTSCKQLPKSHRLTTGRVICKNTCVETVVSREGVAENTFCTKGFALYVLH